LPESRGEPQGEKKKKGVIRCRFVSTQREEKRNRGEYAGVNPHIRTGGTGKHRGMFSIWRGGVARKLKRGVESKKRKSLIREEERVKSVNVGTRRTTDGRGTGNAKIRTKTLEVLKG